MYLDKAENKQWNFKGLDTRWFSFRIKDEDVSPLQNSSLPILHLQSPKLLQGVILGKIVYSTVSCNNIRLEIPF